MDSVKNALAAYPWLQNEYFGNTVQTYLYSLAFILVGLLAVWIADRLILRGIERVARRTASQFDDFLIRKVEHFSLPALYALVIFLGLRDLNMKPAIANTIQAMVTILVAVQAVRLLTRIVQEFLERHMARRAEAAGLTGVSVDHEKRSIRGVLIVIKIVVWVLAGVLVLDNLGIKVTAFITGLGITGIAVALAAQTILGDLFSYFVIFFDRPFQVGHFIKIGDFMGEVENIGIKTTRIRSLSGEVIVMSNKYLTDNQVQNYRMMQRRRAVSQFEVEYGTSDAHLREIPGLVRGIVGGMEKTTFDRCHFKEFAASGLLFETIFYVEVPEFNAYMDILQELNLRLKEALEARNIGFAFPTRTLHIVPPGDAPDMAAGGIPDKGA